MISSSMFNVLGGGALIAAIMAGWSYVVSLFNYIRSCLLVTVIVDSYIFTPTFSYCNKNLYRLPLGSLIYVSKSSYIKKYNYRAGSILVSAIPNSTVFFKGVFPLIMNKSMSSANEKTSSRSSITYIRGTIDIESLMSRAFYEAEDNYFQISQSKDSGKIRRHCINIMHGENGGHKAKVISDERNGESSQEPADMDNYCWELGHGLKYNIEHKTFNLIGLSTDDFEEYMPMGNRYMKYLCFPDHINEAVKELQKWLDSRDWCKDKGVPWKRGWLLHGVPGTGKTALVRALGELLDVPIYAFDLASFNNNSFRDSWKDVAKDAPAIALIEDIDSVFNGRDNVTQSFHNGNCLTFDCLLNCMDGAVNSDGVMTIITTNKPELLDSALGGGTATRPGRIDSVFELGLMDVECRRAIAGRILRDCPETINSVVDDGEGETPAQFQNRCARKALSLYWAKHGKK